MADAGDRLHHPQLPGFWLHPEKGVFEVAPDGHHAEFFRDHPDLLGADLHAAYEDGWVSIRRWVGAADVWALRYHALPRVSATLCTWAQSVIARWPDEAEVAIRSFPGVDADAIAPSMTLQDLAQRTPLQNDIS